MVKREIGVMRFEVNLPNGVYIFDSTSATGKTYMLRAIREYGFEKCFGLTYNDVVDLDDNTVKFLVEQHNPVLLLLDRYDMWNGMLDKYFAEWESRMVILIDAKHHEIDTVTTDICMLSFKPMEYIEVTE